MGTVTAPVSASGSWPAWMARVANPGCLSLLMISHNSVHHCLASHLSFRAPLFGARNLHFCTPRESRFLSFAPLRVGMTTKKTSLRTTLKNLLRQIPLRRIRNHRHHPLA